MISKYLQMFTKLSYFHVAPTCSRQRRDDWLASSHAQHSYDRDRANLHGRRMWRERLSFRSRFLQAGTTDHIRPWDCVISCRCTALRNGSASFAGKLAISVLTNVFRTTFVSVSFLFSPYYVLNFVTRLSRSSINVAMRFNCLKRLRDVRECKYLSSIYYLRNAVHTYLCIV